MMEAGLATVPGPAGLTVYLEVGTPVPWDDLDPEIVDRVRILTNGGLGTFSSCSGHGDRNPWVCVSTTDVEAVYRALQTAGEEGYAISVEYVFPYPTEDHCYAFIRVSWWR